MLADVGSTAHLEDRVGSLSVAQKHLLELAKALAVQPSLLILDEPTAPLGQDRVELLFDRVRAAAVRGTAVVYITHRLAEVRTLADAGDRAARRQAARQFRGIRRHATRNCSRSSSDASWTPRSRPSST